MRRKWSRLVIGLAIEALALLYLFGSVYSGAYFTAQTHSSAVTVRMAELFPDSSKKSDQLPPRAPAELPTAEATATLAVELSPTPSPYPALAATTLNLHVQANGLTDYQTQQNGVTGEVCIENTGTVSAEQISAPLLEVEQADESGKFVKVPDSQQTLENAPTTLTRGERQCLSYRLIFAGTPGGAYRLSAAVTFANPAPDAPDLPECPQNMTCPPGTLGYADFLIPNASPTLVPTSAPAPTEAPTDMPIIIEPTQEIPLPPTQEPVKTLNLPPIQPTQAPTLLPTQEPTEVPPEEPTQAVDPV